MASSLHLDDLIEESFDQEHVSSETNLHDVGLVVGGPTALGVDCKRKDHIRLFKEYISCCRSASSQLSLGKCCPPLSNVSMCNDNESFERSDSAPTVEYVSFLPKSSRPRNQQSPSAAPSGVPAHFSGCDTTASQPTGSCPSPDGGKTTPPTSAVKGRSRRASGAATRRAPAGASPRTLPPPLEAPLDEEAGRVFRSQVAAALGAGRAVWL
mmetsp:Transcript_5876/g.12988  ORF Transcript_5876/g.12988 Transcript_5876/m.12988 type:complete len:211 (-) Transcript_5876:107-739(-)